MFFVLDRHYPLLSTRQHRQTQVKVQYLLLKIIHQGADKARASASATLTTVRNAVGMNY